MGTIYKPELYCGALVKVTVVLVCFHRVIGSAVP